VTGVAYLPLIVAMIGLGLGLGQVTAPCMSVATVGLTSDAGIASAMVNTTQQAGGSVGTSLLNTLARGHDGSGARTYSGLSTACHRCVG
jgi:hypothetical protein